MLESYPSIDSLPASSVVEDFAALNFDAEKDAGSGLNELSATDPNTVEFEPDDPENPLSWPAWRKWTILTLVSLMNMLGCVLRRIELLHYRPCLSSLATDEQIPVENL